MYFFKRNNIFTALAARGLVSAGFLFAFCNSGHSPVVLAAHAGLSKIPVTRDQVYDLSGYADEGDGNPYGLFDENAFVDPLYPGAGTDFVPVTTCQPKSHTEIYFGPHGSRIVIDLTRFYNLAEIWVYDKSATQDSVRFSTGNLRSWNTVAGLTSNGFLGRNGWKKIDVNQHTRYVQIAFSSPKTNFTEMVLYGTPDADSPGAAASTVIGHRSSVIGSGPSVIDSASTANGQRPSANDSVPKFTTKPLSQFLGVNYIIEEDPRWLKPFHYSRMYNFALDYDDDTIHEGRDVKFNMLHYGYYDGAKKKYVFQIDTLQKVNDGNIWYSIRGVSRKMSNLGYGDKDRPLDKPGLDPEKAASYTRHARMMWNLAAFFGYSKTDTNRMSLSHEPRQSGRMSMHLFENGNEEDAWWEGKKYGDPVSIFNQSTADWDGDEGRLGEGTGIHSADTSARLMMSGLIGLDTNRVKVYRFLCDQLREDHRFVWTGGIQYHHYANKNDRGISPEEDCLRSTLAVVRNSTRRIAPGIDCFLGEIGYDKTRESTHATPLLPGYTSAQSQAIMLLRTINASFFSGFDACILYWLKDGSKENDPQTYQSSGLLRNPGDGKTQAFPSWYQISGMVNVLGNYIPDSIISEKGDVWIYRYRNISHPDSLASFVYCPTVTGKRIARYTFDPGPFAGSLKEVSFSDSTDHPMWKILSPDKGRTEVEIGEKPVVFFWHR